MYLYVKLHYDANRFLPAESKDCINSASNEQPPPGIRKITSDEDCRVIANATKCIAFVEQITNLARTNILVYREKICDKPTDIEETYTGSALYL